MITIELMGGLGNQLFQVFALISYALTNKNPFYFEDKDIIHGTRKKYYWNSLLSNIDKFKGKVCRVQNIIREQGFNYNQLPIIADNNTKMMGYFQSYKYFESQYTNICKFIKLEDKKSLFIDKYDYSNTISMHFRLGDYKNLQQHHPILTLDHYEKSLTHIISQSNKDNWKVLYFCEDEDLEYVSDKINKLHDKFNNLSFEKINSQYEDWEQMMIMSLCSHNIIANSSFSWWGAYFNSNENIVCYPETWFGPAQGNKNMIDMFPDHWFKVID